MSAEAVLEQDAEITRLTELYNDVEGAADWLVG